MSYLVLSKGENMSKILMSGTCRIGEIGKPTELIDCFGEALSTGDLVSLSVYDENNSDQFNDFCGIEFVCNNEFQDDGLDKSIYVMGIASEHVQYEDDFGETIVKQNHKRWRIRKVKGYEELVDGEKWGVVRVVFNY
jgi:hypothetical protein